MTTRPKGEQEDKFAGMWTLIRMEGQTDKWYDRQPNRIDSEANRRGEQANRQMRRHMNAKTEAWTMGRQADFWIDSHSD